MTDEDDYERLESDIDDFDTDIYVRYGDHYSNLSNEKKEEAILDVWFENSPRIKSRVGYEESARQLRQGLDYYQNHKLESFNVKTFTRRGKSYTYVFKNGKFSSRVKD